MNCERCRGESGRAYWVRVLDSVGRSVAETPGMNRLLPVELFSPKEISPPTSCTPETIKPAVNYFR